MRHPDPTVTAPPASAPSSALTVSRRLACMIGLLVALLCSASPGQAAQDIGAETQRMLSAAEAAYAEGSFGRANELYSALVEMELEPATARWVAYRRADTAWRRLATAKISDDTPVQKAREQLLTLISAIEHPDDRDEVWALAHESIADSWWQPQRYQNWGGAWSHYEAALDWWAGARDVEAARDRYLDIVWRMARPSYARHHGSWYAWQSVPGNIFENAVRIARTPEDRARAHLLLAFHYTRSGYNWFTSQRVEREFEKAIELGHDNPWHDDALFYYAGWLASNGRVVVADNGGWSSQPDFVQAVKLYRQLLGAYREGETPHYREAKRQIDQITARSLGASVQHVFLPDAEVTFNLNWRNLGSVELSLYPVDLTRDVDPTREHKGVGAWVQQIDLGRSDPVRRWTYETGDTGEHRPGGEQIKLDKPLAVGAYVLVATGGGKTVRDLVLVSDLMVVTKQDPQQMLAFVCDARTSAPIDGATVRRWRYDYDNKKRWRGDTADGRTGADGLAVFETSGGGQQLVTVAAGERQTFAVIGHAPNANANHRWKIYATTDRPAYRPDETVFWKMTARTRNQDGYHTPSNQTVHYEISGPRGSVTKGDVTLNAFGSAWGDLELDPSMTLGEYRITFTTKQNGHVGQATLFRLEEYKLPEFEVTVKPPTDEEDRPIPCRLGETVQIEIDASYYFGGPVTDANVQVLVYQRPFHSYWAVPRPYAWCYDTQRPYNRYYDPGQVITQQTLTTDENGLAILALDTSTAGAQDTEFTIEARVTDASRREIVGRGVIRATRQSYYVHAHVPSKLHEPGDRVEVEFRSIDANDRPVEVTGEILVTRDTWYEIWIDPRGREHTGRSLNAICEGLDVDPGFGFGWMRRHGGYRSEEILREAVSTNADGELTFAFTPEKIGFYRVAWRSRDDGGVPIAAQATVWIVKDTTDYLGYRNDGIQIIVDKDTFRVGDTAAVMISTEIGNRHVLLTAEGNAIHHHEVVHVTDTVKLVHVPITERFLPNVMLSATTVRNGQVLTAQEGITIPPVEQYLTVDVSMDEPAYGPREEGTLTVRTTDVDGKPLSTELTLALVDASVLAIQSDYAGDPRPFFFNDRQPHHVATHSTAQSKSFARPSTEDEKRQQAWNEAPLGQAAGEGGGMLFDAPGRRRRSAGRDDSFAAKSMARSAAPSAAPMESAVSMDMDMEAMKEDIGMAGGGGGDIDVVVRSDFASTLLWRPDVITNAEGVATVPVTFNDALTKWKATARAATTGNQVGIGDTAVRTRQPLIARLQAPRFFVVGDEVTLSGVFNNNTETPMQVTPVIEADGLVITSRLLDGQPVKGEAGPIEIPAGGMTRVDWRAVVETPGEAKVTLTGRGDGASDAMVKSYPVLEHGIDRLLVRAGAMRGDGVTVRLDLPPERRADSTTFTVQVTPSLAVTMLDAVPYLVDYPYGCTEQTMSRFLPAVVTAKTLSDLGLDPEDVLGRAFGGVDRDLRNEKDPKGEENRANLAKLDEIVRAGLHRLADFQHNDGGWGWWKQGESDPFMTSYVLWGLSLARDADVAVDPKSMQRAAAFLDKRLVELEQRPDLQAWVLHALAAHAGDGAKPTKFQRAAVENLWNQHVALNAYTRSLFAIALHEFGAKEQAAILVRNLRNDVIRDNAPDASILVHGAPADAAGRMGTAHWGEVGVFYRWSQGGVESTAFALRAMLAVNPDDELIEPVMNWLVKNRRGTQWSNTRDTSIVVLAMNDYLRTSGELATDVAYDLRVNGEVVASPTIAAADILDAPSTFLIKDALVRDGVNTIEITRRDGTGPLYFTASAEFFSLEEPIPAGGNEIFVHRAYASLSARETLLKGFVYDRNPISDGGYVVSGDRVEVILTVEAKNNLEYVVLEDLKPAGLEAVEIKSGTPIYARELRANAVDRRFGPDGKADGSVRVPMERPRADYTGRQQRLHQELRDSKVAVFISSLPEGIWEIRYDMRAEVPGRFHALPLMGHAMYVPEIRGNSAEIRMTVK